MSANGDRTQADADNPYARPERDLPAAIAPDDRLGRIAGWLFLGLGALAVLNMIIEWTNGHRKLELGGLAMLLIGRGLLKRSDTARRWGIGCAGFYLVAMVIGGGVLWWVKASGKLDARFLATLPSVIVVLGMCVGLLAVFVALLWMLLHPRTRAAYQRRPRVARYGDRSRAAAARQRRAEPPGT